MICPFCRNMIPDGVGRCPCCGAFFDNVSMNGTYQGTVENRNVPVKYLPMKYVRGIWFAFRVAIAFLLGGIFGAIFYGISRYCYNVAIQEYNYGSVGRAQRYAMYRNIFFFLAVISSILSLIIGIVTSVIALPFKIFGAIFG